jgi:CubicO group peptidase (beta-lactamase class C family)
MAKTVAMVFVALVLPAGVCPAQDVTRMDAILQSFAANGTFSGSALVARGDDVIFEKSYGLANAEWSIPNRADTRFRVASITKQFTAAAILLLEERGRLTLDDPVARHLAVPSSWSGMTVFHLLTHTAGFAGLQTPAAARGAPVQNPGGTLAGFVKAQTDRPLVSRPGDTFSYTNTGYFILGHIIEKISGQPYEQFIRANILDPLGMRDTGLDSAAAIARRASSYAVTPNGLINTIPAAAVAQNSAAGFYSTPRDLLRWHAALYGNRVLAPASLRKMTTPFQGDYGLGVYVRTIDGRKAMTHGGGAPPFANLTYFPDTRITVVVLGNLNVAPAAELAGLLGALAHGEAVQLSSEKKAIELGPDVLARYAGVYEAAGDNALIVTVQGDHLLVETRGGGGSGLSIFPESETVFFMRDMNVRWEFVRDGSGAVSELVMHQGTRQDRARRTTGGK